jgi:hypothetical protein
VLVCYLDDSGTDRENRIVTLAGYVAKEAQWRTFETEVEPIFAQKGVKVLHATQLESTDGEFKGWKIINKQAFVARTCLVLSHHVPLGMTMSALKGVYWTRAAESNRKRTCTPYSFCFQRIIDWILTSLVIGKAAHSEGVAFILESGNKNNAEAEEQFHSVRKLHNLEKVLTSICFVDKASCRAIQMADLLAFYSRRHGIAMEKARMEEKERVRRTPGMMMNIITERIPHLTFVATDFGPSATGSRFFAGDLK